MPPWRFMYETTDVLSVRISTCCYSSCVRNSFRAKKTASNSKWFMCHWFWGSNHSPEAGNPSHTAPQPHVDASVVTTTREATKPRGTPRRQSFDAAAGDHDTQMSRSPRSDDSPDDILPKLTPWVPAASEISSNEQSCLLWNGAGKTKWPPRVPARGRLSFPRSLSKLPDMLWTDSGRECSFACLHIALHIALGTSLFPFLRLRFIRRGHTKGSDTVSVNKAPAFRNSKSGLRCATEEPMFKSVCLS